MKVRYSIDDAKRSVTKIKGVELSFKVNTGRNKIIEFAGRVENIYASVFTVRSAENTVKTFPYSDVLTGNIKFALMGV